MEELVIGRYRVIRKLGTGGMAEVYAAKHELMDRNAAIKLLLPEMSARDDIVRRFFQEAQAAARIEHPGIVQVFDVGYTPDGRAYLVMEQLAGEPLSRRLQRQGALSLEETIILMRQLAGAIECAHGRGIIHRDLKPDNLFLVPDPDLPRGERVKVLDFGLAKLLETSTSPMELTAQGAVFGTPSYMAPEQCQSAANVDSRADLYSIGCIFYACLCGRPPFTGNGMAMLMAHIAQAPVPPRQHVAAIPPAIDALILQLLEKDPARRVPSCAALIAGLDHAVAITGITLDAGGRDNSRARVAAPGAGAVQGTFVSMAENGSLSPRDRTLVPAAGYLDTRALTLAESPRGLRGPGWEPRPRAGSASDSRAAARQSMPTIDNGEIEATLGRDGRDGNRKLWWLAGAGLLSGLMAAGVAVGPDDELSGGLEPIVLMAAEQPAQRDTAEETPAPWPVIARPLAEIDHLLEQAEEAVSRRAWSEALQTLRAARQHPDADERRMARVLELARMVRAGQQHQAAFERLRPGTSNRPRDAL